MGRWTRATAALGLLLVLGGCPGDQSGQDAGVDAGPECTKRSDCANGEACLPDGTCGPCESSGQCLLKETCDPELLVCTERVGWSADCTLNDDCQAGEWCHQGACLNRDRVRLCPAGLSSECGKGERCNTTNLVCEEDLGCTEPGDCAPEETCNPGSRICVPRCNESTAGSVCGLGEKCFEERCVQCSTNADCGLQQVCDAAGVCGESPRCYSDRDCQVPLVCYKPTGACLARPPPCVSDEQCTLEERCEIGTGRCVPRGCQRDVFEPNDTREQAFNVAASLYEGLTLCENDVDFFAVTLARGDQLGVRVDADPFAEATFTTLVQDGEGRTVASGRLLVSYVAPVAATWYVAVATTDQQQPYDIRFLLSRGTPCDDDGLEPNDLATQATPLNGAGSVDGAICPQDVDHFAVTVPADKPLRASLTHYNSAAGLLELCVLEGSTVLGCSDALEDPSVTVPAAAAARPLVVRVRGAGERTANAYTLQVEFP